ncbi:MAG: hypothetical protein EZS28_038847 [Streblomastix strix]|uniref:Uncharacterized protein n=1 Tax=Streblomastix strix TaxID=222440 RepID=A0A5J4U4D0_9EUKA|nr:MAG: hypothetical protein EZS28_038847 [Streblomastix strix]
MDQAHVLKNLIENGTQIEYFDNGYIMQVKDKIKGIKTFLSLIYGSKFIITGGASNQILLANGETQDTGDFLPRVAPHATLQMIIEPNDDIRNQGIRIMKNKANWDSFVLTGCNDDPTNKDGVWKMGSTSSQFRIQKQEDEAYDYKGLIIDFDCTTLKFNNQIVSPLPIPPIEYAIYQSIAYGMYEQLIWGTVKSQKERVYISLQITHSNPNTQSQTGYTLFSIVNNDIKPKFSGTTHNIPLNAVLFAQKVYGYPIDWTGAIAMDCFINPQGNVIINTQCQISLLNDFCVQVCDSYAVYNQSA